MKQIRHRLFAICLFCVASTSSILLAQTTETASLPKLGPYLYETKPDDA